MTASPTSALLGILDKYQPRRLLCISTAPVPAAMAYCEQTTGCDCINTADVPLPPELANQRYDLAIVANELERLDKRAGTELLAGLRNLSVSRMAVLIDHSLTSDWQDTDFFALALQRTARFAQGDRLLTLYTYDLAEYKQVPDWLNSKYWANPEMFGKYWW
ncbi:hypothetical protein KEM63_12660 [Halopseudomonas nanhaiensis]|uniref:DUF6231 family protein n=1 Tax=Halopseudomonas nanhaiensis TaxID=2830842 RepID=UPI001CBB534B|nr:DUF6231 family protein [Halopseudomonas nanhaiensis]UAW97645.1 hypothetical protein KEM63_12660 [Halopseudomonas nanhaiensis]